VREQVVYLAPSAGSQAFFVILAKFLHFYWSFAIFDQKSQFWFEKHIFWPETCFELCASVI